MWTSSEVASIAKTFNDSVLSDFLTDKEIEVIPASARGNLRQRIIQPKHNHPVRRYCEIVVQSILRWKLFKFNIFTLTWICLTGWLKSETALDFKAPGCGSIFRSWCQKKKPFSMCLQQRLFRFKLTSCLTKRDGWNSLKYFVVRTSKTSFVNCWLQKKKVPFGKAGIDLTSLFAPISG